MEPAWKLSPRDVVVVLHSIDPMLFIDENYALPNLLTFINEKGREVASLLTPHNYSAVIENELHVTACTAHETDVGLFFLSPSRVLHSALEHTLLKILRVAALYALERGDIVVRDEDVRTALESPSFDYLYPSTKLTR
jgi:hypothetical protein